MDIRDRRGLHNAAADRLANAKSAGTVVLIYAAIALGSSALVTLVNYVLGLQIDKTGGLSNMGLRSFLSTIQSVLPMVQSAVLLCVEVGYVAAMLRIARGQYTSPQTLRLGFDRFWQLLRCTLMQAFIHLGLCMLAFYLAMQIYMISPLSNAANEILTPLLEQHGNSMEFLLDTAIYNQLVQAMVPLFIIFGILWAVFALPVAYSFRMVNYVLIDNPGFGALAVLRQSKAMMRGNRLALLRLDLSLWWYYGLALLTAAVCYGDVLLGMAGIPLPVSDTVAYFLFYAAYIALQFAVIYFLRNQVEVVYAQAYESIRPREESGGVVLGNIFQM